MKTYLKRAAGGGMAAVCCVTNGLMRATESTYVLVAVDGIVPVTVRVVCLYDSKRAIFIVNLGGTAGYSHLSHIRDRCFIFIRKERL